MSSWRSSSSKSLFDQDAMLDLEDRLDYEPEGVEIDENYADDDIAITRKERIFSSREISEEEEQDRGQVPEPSGLKDESSNHIRNRMRYHDLHIDVETGSCRSRYGRYLQGVNLKFLDSSSEDEEEDGTLTETGADRDRTHQSRINLANGNRSTLDNNFVDSHRQDLTYENYYASSDSQTFENMISPKEIEESVRSSSSSTPIDARFSEKSQNNTNLSARRRPVSPNFGYVPQKNAADVTHAQQMTVRIKRRRDTSTSSSVSDTDSIVQSPRIQQTFFPTKDRRDISPNLEFLQQNCSRNEISSNGVRNRQSISPSLLTSNNATDVVRGMHLLVRTENVREMAPILDHSTRNDSPDLPSTERAPLISDDSSQPQQNNVSVSPRQPRKSLNFKIQVQGDKRIFIQPKDMIIKKKHKPWVTPIEDYLDDWPIVRLTSHDKVLEFLPEDTNPGIKSRLGEYPESKSSTSSKSDQDLSVFKVPLRRPPTRQSSTSKNISVLVDLKSQQRQVQDVEQPSVSHRDDIISIMAGSDISLADVDELRDSFEDSSVKEEPVSLPETSGTEQRKLTRTAEWITQGFEPIRHQHVPAFYKGLCYNYFLNNNCKDNQCARSHVLINQNTHIDQICYLTAEVLKEAYDFAIGNTFLYRQIYTHFANAFALKDMKDELIKMIKIIFEETCYQINPEEGLDVVLSALQNTNLTSFEDTFEYLIMQTGLKLYPTLGNVLFEIILNKPNVSEHWSIIRKLVIAGEKMNHKQGSKFLVHLMKIPINLEVCKQVYQYILTYMFVELPKISPDIRDPFMKICAQGTVPNHTAEVEANIKRNLRDIRLNYEPTPLLQSKARVSSPTTIPPHPTVGVRNELPSSQLKRPASAVLMYNKEGLHYDPANDYIHPLKKRVVEPIDEFDRIRGRHPVQDDAWPTGEIVSSPNGRARSNEPGPSSSRIEIDRIRDRRPVQADAWPTGEIVSSPNARAGSNEPGPSSSRIKIDRIRVRPRRPVQDDTWPTGEIVSSPNARAGSNEPGPSSSRIEIDRTRARPRRPVQDDTWPAGEIVSSPNARTRSNEPGPSSSRVEWNVENNEEAVSSSSDAKFNDKKPPEHPQFGKLYFDPHYQFNISLHNLYLEEIDNVDIDEEDVHRLNDCVKISDGKTFLALIEKYKGPKTVQNFISMTLAHLKGMNQMVARTYHRLLDSIDRENPDFYGNRCVRVILEVITMNLLFELNSRHMLDDVYIFLKRFSDWDSLVTSRIFIFNTDHGISIIGRYLFIAGLLVYNKPELTYEILVCPTLHLLEKYENWPYKPHCPIPEIFNSDLQTRNDVITAFLKNGYLLNPVSVIQFYKAALNREIWNFDVKHYVNPMVMDLIRKNHTFLKLFANEIKQFHKYIRNDTLRSFVITLCQQRVSDRDLFLVYETCVERNIYQKLVTGEKIEYVINIKTSMHVCEIDLIVKYYFQKLEEIKRVPPGSDPLRFDIHLSGESFGSNQVPILNENKILMRTNDLLRSKLQQCSISSTSPLPNVVEVKKEVLEHYLDGRWM